MSSENQTESVGQPHFDQRSQQVNTQTNVGGNSVHAAGERSVAAGRDVINSIVVTGDGAVIYQSGAEALSFYALDEAFRMQQRDRSPADFYGGTRPNWANIAHAHDAPRERYATLRAFVEAPDLPPQRMGLLLGLAGEGKTTLLMRLAWNLAEDGYNVLWRHSGWVFNRTITGQALTVPQDRPLILCFDQVDQEEHLPTMIQELAEQGIHFVVVGTARTHEWQLAGMEGHLRAVRLQKFLMPPLNRPEVEGILDKLAAANALDRLAELSRQAQVRHFLHRLEADGQLLPALLTARRRAESFEQIVLDVLEGVYRREDGPFLIRAYALLSAVHRFGFWLSRGLFAQALEIPEADVGPRVLGKLSGELLEVTEAPDGWGGSGHLYTRHPLIAEKVFGLAGDPTRRWAEPRYVYRRLFEALRQQLASMPETPERKLLTLLPLAVKRQGNLTQARMLFQFAAQSDPTNPVIWQAWALLEKEQGNVDEARRLFRQGVQADPTHAYLWQAWALLEKEQRNVDEARRLFRQGVQAAPTNAPLWQAWALLEKEQGDVDEAHRLFRQGTTAAPTDAHLWQAWALLEKEQGDVDEARRLFRQGTDADPTNAHLWQAWALLEKEQGDVAEARRLFRQGTTAAPTNAHLWQAWALLEKEQGNVAEARRLFCQGTTANPTDAPTWQAWAIMEGEAGNYGEARRLFQKAVEVNAQDAVTWQSWGVMESKAGDLKSAIPLLERALQFDSRNPIILQSLGIVYGELGDVEKAREYFEQAVALTPDDPVIWCAWGQVEMKHRHNERAQQLFERALVLNSQDALTWSLLGSVKCFRRDYEAAEHCFDEAIRLSKDPRRQARAYLEKAKMLSRIQGREADAEYVYEAALHLDAGNAFAHSAYAAFLYWRHRYPEAEEHYKCALQLRSDDTYVMASLASMLARLEGRGEEAEAYFLKALQAAPDDARTHAFYANFLKWRQRFDEAERHFVRSLELKEDAKVRQQHEEMQRRRRSEQEQR